MRRILLYAFALTLLSCDPSDLVTEGMVPVYISFDDFSFIKSNAPQPYTQLGKIVTTGDYIYLNEINKGIHVVNNSQPNDPVKEYYWSIPGNKEFTLVDGVLYADNGKHLLVIDISKPDAIVLVKVIKDQYDPGLLEEYPRNYQGWFECYDPSKGIIFDWMMSKLDNPKCVI